MHIVIIGNGIGGITAARFIRKLSDHKITVISNETDFFYARTALMYVYMGHMRFEDIKPYEDWFWEKNRIELKRGYVEEVVPDEKKLVFAKGDQITYDKLIIACGSKSNKFGWPGQDLKRVYGLYHYQDLEAMERYSDGLERAVIVGGGLIGVEMAEMFQSRDIPVTMLVREECYWNNVLPKEESEMVSRHILDHGVDLRLNTELKEIIDDGNGEACGVITKDGEQIDCGYVGLTAGVSPNIDFLSNSGIECDKGILTDENLQTNKADIFAVGDCAQQREPKPGRKPIEAVWYAARIMGETAAYNICGHTVEYDPGLWFNSAKFMDIEYQVYGDIPDTPPEGIQTLYWEHEDGRKSVRLNYREEDESLTGVNLMGIRYRQEVCEKWINERTPIEKVLQNLPLANFDPEFYDSYEKELIAVFNEKTGRDLQLKKKRSLRGVLQFLGKSSRTIL